MSSSSSIYVYIGNWDRHKAPPGNGFGVCRYDAQAGELELIDTAFPDITVGAACIDVKRRMLYCTDECSTLPGNFIGGGGQVYALAIDPQTGSLTELNHLPSYGSLPSYLALDASGDYLIVTHHTDRVPITQVVEDVAGTYRIAVQYDDATTVLFPLDPQGSIGAPQDVYWHLGDGGPLPRQTHAQLHSVTMSPCGSFFVICDKGNDALQTFALDRGKGVLSPLDTLAAQSPPGSSPRYTVFHPTLPYLFVNHETRALVSAFRYQRNGELDHICTVSALPDAVADHFDMKQSDLVIHPSGKYLYSMIRGISAVSVFEIDEASGAVALIETVTLDGTGPRGCAIAPDGRFMVIAALASKEVLVWAIGADGRLSPTGKKIRQPNPGTVTFYQPV